MVINDLKEVGLNTLASHSLHLPVQRADREQLGQTPSVISFHAAVHYERSCGTQQTQNYIMDKYHNNIF